MNVNGFKKIVDNKLRGALGVTDFDKKEIRINKKKSKKAGPGEVLKTIIHEHKHVHSPKMKEKNVEAWTQKEFRKLPKKLREAYYNAYPNKKS